MADIKLPYDAFVRSIKQNRDVEHGFFLGAGASTNSGIQSAYDCIWEWKKDIFLSKNPHLAYQYKNIKSDTVRKAVQLWLDNEGGYPELDSDKEYPYYAEKANPIEGDRRKYFQRLSEEKKPSLGYHLLCFLAKEGIVRSVWTTNFDNLMVKAAHIENLTPIEINLESEKRLYRTSSKKELLCIELHGDYKYGPLKNTSSELDNQSSIFINALKNELITRSLIVIGYSGRDESVMNALTEAYSTKGAGRLYWCGYGDGIPDRVASLIGVARDNGRDAFFIPTDGFDKTLYNLSIACFEDKNEYLVDIIKIKDSFAPKEHSCSKFVIDSIEPNKIINSNLLPFSIPKECFQFEIEFAKDDKPWKICNDYSKAFEISAVPFKKMIYAFGTKDELCRLFSTKIKSDIVRTPISRDSLFDIPPLKDLVLKTITKFISNNVGLYTNYKNKIWNSTDHQPLTVNAKAYNVFRGINLALFFDHRYNYLAITPTFIVDTNEDIEKDIIKEISRAFYSQLYGRKPNTNFANYINTLIFENKLFENHICGIIFA